MSLLCVYNVEIVYYNKIKNKKTYFRNITITPSIHLCLPIYSCIVNLNAELKDQEHKFLTMDKILKE